MALTKEGQEVKVHGNSLLSSIDDQLELEVDKSEIDSVRFTRAERADNYGALEVILKDGEVLLFRVLSEDALDLVAKLRSDVEVLADPTPGDPLDEDL